ncbi:MULTISPECIES: extracellular solute-binding protein [unclassified Oceanispirochaeta]|uniref:extracellular solute-binding protein n=1 Tax=unclassified Oceanispirochaeta TaxID=2635722 RepID=UPI000E09BE13|nr:MULTISPECIES: extracellular solute-binding protein [unclassified Oceanispirochaeta]MBF9016507.1 ABC transporter substrate-binding protein [Oceanispirochaeta sp. M2]NPD72969.1 ABC transporter substrate-binding protein [Oceanispirochaeta sp. M1]RDG31312.1 ABC transporter substrate-binding protein [Oceanispirochaeta sp. M1]
MKLTGHGKKWLLGMVIFLLAGFLFAKGDKESSTASSEKDEGITEMELFVNHSWWTLKNWNGTIPEEITNETGVRLNIHVATDSNQLPLMIASDELPELIYTSNEGSGFYKMLSNSNVCYPWNELIEKYAVDFKPDPMLAKINTVKDGNFYTILNNLSSQNEWNAKPKAIPAGMPGIAIRTDLMEELGNPPLQNLVDFENTLMMVKKNYPDMIPLIMEPNWLGAYFRAAFGTQETGFEIKDDKLIHVLYEQEQLDYYLFLNRLYRNGLITAENFAIKGGDSARAEEFALNGKAFAYQHEITIADRLNTKLERSDKNFRFNLISNLLSENFEFYQNEIGWSGVFITKENKNPEKAINFVKYMSSDKGQMTGLWGIEGRDWSMHEEGYPIFNYNSQDTDFLDHEGIFWWGLLFSTAANEGLGKFVPGTEMTEAGLEMKKVAVFRPELGLIKPEPESDIDIISKKIKDMVEIEEINIYLAESEAEAEEAYYRMIGLAERIGLEKYSVWANEQYGMIKDSF